MSKVLTTVPVPVMGPTYQVRPGQLVCTEDGNLGVVLAIDGHAATVFTAGGAEEVHQRVTLRVLAGDTYGTHAAYFIELTEAFLRVRSALKEIPFARDPEGTTDGR